MIILPLKKDILFFARTVSSIIWACKILGQHLLQKKSVIDDSATCAREAGKKKRILSTLNGVLLLFSFEILVLFVLINFSLV